jgi:hypothetical protein
VTEEEELDEIDVAVGRSAETMERRALALIAQVRNTGKKSHYHGPGNVTWEYGLPKVCERLAVPLPHGCWDDPSHSPYALYGAHRWCNACIAYAALHGTLPRPEERIDGTTRRLVGVSP